MGKFLLFLFSAIVIYSCNVDGGKSSDSFKYYNTPLASLKEWYRANLSNPTGYGAIVYFANKHKDEIFKTMEVVEEVEVEKDIVLIFYRYSVGTDIVKKTTYMRKIDGLYLPYYKYYYYGESNKDPFHNGKGDEAKALLDKADEWDKNENIWWAF